LLDFKYVPDGQITRCEKNDRLDGDRLWFYERPLELLYFIVFCGGCLSIIGSAIITAYLLLGFVPYNVVL
jgi:hypothetical protein